MQKRGDHHHLWSAKWNRLEKVGCRSKTSSRIDKSGGGKPEHSMDKIMDFGTNSMK